MNSKIFFKVFSNLKSGMNFFSFGLLRRGYSEKKRKKLAYSSVTKKNNWPEIVEKKAKTIPITKLIVSSLKKT